MTLDELKRTSWWTMWVVRTGYEPDKESIRIALSPDLAVDVRNCGEWWSIIAHPEGIRNVSGQKTYSMARVSTRKAAIALCREMGWKVKR